MNSFNALLRKEILEIRRTWRIWVLPGVLLFFAVTGPLTAYFSKELLESVLPGSGIQIEIPDPTWLDTLAQWNKNLAQIGTLTVLLTCGGMINAEGKQGTQALILTKPISRNAYVLAKYCAQAGLLLVSAGLSMLVEFGISRLLFPDSCFTPLGELTGLWILQVLLLLAVTLVGSAWLDSAIAASGLGFAAMMMLLLMGLWGPALRYSPAGLSSIAGEIAADGGATSALLWPVLSAVAGTAALVWLACWVFRRREL